MSARRSGRTSSWPKPTQSSVARSPRNPPLPRPSVRQGGPQQHTCMISPSSSTELSSNQNAVAHLRRGAVAFPADLPGAPEPRGPSVDGPNFGPGLDSGSP
eukprot:7313349-Pyramimonas_sp.AAC.1